MFRIGVAVASCCRLSRSFAIVACGCRLSLSFVTVVVAVVVCRVSLSLVSVAVKIWISSRFVEIVILWDWLESVAGPKAS